MERPSLLTARVLPRLAAGTGVATLVLASLAAPSYAGPNHDSPKGGHNGPPATEETVTEENDDDGVGNNIPDSGDNRHPSGKDRSVESGGSGNQGRSPSNPDGGGPDKPGGTGGVDRIDQDGNNGCGNDDDFEDDNNGRCLGRQGEKPDNHEPETKPGTKAVNRPTQNVTQRANLGENPTPAPVAPPAPAVLGVTLANPGAVAEQVSLAAGEVAPAVLAAVAPRPSVTASAARPAGSLPRTGYELLRLAVLGLVLVVAGALASRAGSRRYVTRP